MYMNKKTLRLSILGPIMWHPWELWYMREGEAWLTEKEYCFDR